MPRQPRVVPSNEWGDTQLWIALTRKTGPTDRQVRNTLEKWMPQISSLLNQGGTAPADFTLHDASHSRRVAERMFDVIPKDVFACLSSYELALLLLSAYLHDIGMTPERKKVDLHYKYLLNWAV